MEDDPIEILIIVITCLLIALVIGMTLWFFIWVLNKSAVENSDEHGNNLPNINNSASTSADIDPNSINNLGNKDNAIGIDQSMNNPCTAINLTNTDGKCTCAFPFFGPYCSREYHDSDYVSIGTDSDLQNLDYTSENVNGVSSLSYTKTNDPTDGFNSQNIMLSGQSCTSVCNDNPNCKGIIYNSNGCSIITSDITLKRNIDHTNLHKENPTIFLNKRGRVIVNDKVFLYSNQKPFRYWVQRGESISNPQAKKPNGFISLDQNIPIQLTWAPQRILNESHLLGIWSTNPINLQKLNKQINYLYFDTKGLADTSAPNYSLNLPNFITNAPLIYVMYVPKSTIQNIPHKYITV